MLISQKRYRKTNRLRKSNNDVTSNKKRLTEVKKKLDDHITSYAKLIYDLKRKGLAKSSTKNKVFLTVQNVLLKMRHKVI